VRTAPWPAAGNRSPWSSPCWTPCPLPSAASAGSPAGPDTSPAPPAPPVPAAAQGPLGAGLVRGLSLPPGPRDPCIPNSAPGPQFHVCLQVAVWPWAGGRPSLGLSLPSVAWAWWISLARTGFFWVGDQSTAATLQGPMDRRDHQRTVTIGRKCLQAGTDRCFTCRCRRLTAGWRARNGCLPAGAACSGLAHPAICPTPILPPPFCPGLYKPRPHHPGHTCRAPPPVLCTAFHLDPAPDHLGHAPGQPGHAPTTQAPPLNSRPHPQSSRPRPRSSRPCSQSLQTTPPAHPGHAQI
jgi:hypothetical protein